MKLSALIPLISLSAPTLTLALSDASSSSHQSPRLTRRTTHLSSRAPSDDVLDINNFLSTNYKNGDLPPGHQSGDASGQVVVLTNGGGADDDSQSPQCSSTVFIGGADVQGSFSTGWKALPQITGFDLLRDVSVASGGIVQPYYQLRGRDPSQVKRLIISQPGLPRDTWKYVNLIRNAMLCAVSNSSNNINLSELMIAAPAWLNTDDASAGAAEANDVVFSKGSWNLGSQSSAPASTSVSSYQVMDTLLTALLSRFPNVNQVWIAGHSLGASFVQRYALVKKPDNSDAVLNFWAGNAGSYAWPIKSRPVQPSGSCASTYDDWAYGLSSGPVYRQADVQANVSAVQQQYYGRRVVVALGTADDGAGDSACEAQFEGSTHLERGSNLQSAMKTLPGGIPARHAFDFVQGVAHEDYLMFSSPAALQHLFVENFNTKGTSSGAGTTSASPSSTKSGGGSKPTTSTNSGGGGNTGTGGSGDNKGSGVRLTGLAFTGVSLIAVLCGSMLLL
ncbi:hypothetical protein OC846_006578 [Tilletia horrida]|uniref:Uncharacterized protein n=1 Tax=Tilletia horrida TaxID=155126 RepID=A0AAN6GIK6_9BASI|nr:hypothetical protein OC846_006578 [Tilletia horrida]KAK0559388.1 hypothetical protein OC861_006663 [Tilletia horrida]